MIKAIALLLSFSLLAACTGKPMFYTDVEILSIQQVTPNETEIIFRTQLESLYHCPGVLVENLAPEFVRCSINDKCKVDFQAELQTDGTSKVLIPGIAEQIKARIKPD
ncbi:hypothetical protein [Bowmanella pacifica]|uniref:Lipoprotein n=1 Tax=Bowmanella pacifica TaxID=502051 RepID=A0A917YVT9_9ALTE|nr:hypothetical protein [Bowmanella pacifica]GGO67736.1 hypothetical protein GCM10010982_14930 [Bowmanella pacifica]